MTTGGRLQIPHVARVARARPHNTVRVRLYLRYQEGEDRNTPWFHLELLRACQNQLEQSEIQVVVTLAGLKSPGEYTAALAAIAPPQLRGTISRTVKDEWGWSMYCYQDDSFRQQLAVIPGKCDVAVGINTSALDLAAAAGCVVLRDREWKQAEYADDYYNLFLLSGPTYGIFETSEGTRQSLFKDNLERILRDVDALPRKYFKVTSRFPRGEPID
jgi:hypothetical protein